MPQMPVIRMLRWKTVMLELARPTSMPEIIREKSDEAEIQAQRDAEYRKKVTDAFFEYGKLRSIPSQRKKERIVLEVIADAFEYDRACTERKVNSIIADFFDDFCTIRRDMVAENLPDRDAGKYWRVKAKE